MAHGRHSANVGFLLYSFLGHYKLGRCYEPFWGEEGAAQIWGSLGEKIIITDFSGLFLLIDL